MAKNICILATRTGISTADFASIKALYSDAHFTLIVPKFDGKKSANIDIWTDGARRGFLKVLTISRRMSWASFDLVINWQQGGLERALCFMLLPKPKIITKADILRDIA
ncbi:MAG: hypothetical protein HRU29_07605 [Rhizobiales bacterium]|nr:hypothetical protein [Hyphomicrobiales bacterium]NRB14252.1 hypothetical protein [Hyphomicrobiales bacterium]